MILLLAASLLLQVQQQQSGYRIAPVDDTTRDRTYENFVKKLNKVAVKRDVKAFRKLCADDIVTGTGRKTDPEEKGWKAFEERWKPASPDTELWETITDVLSLGSVRMHPRLYVAPYLVWKFPNNLSPRRYWVMVRDQVPLRETPDRDGRQIAALSFDVVEVIGQEAGEWVHIRSGSRRGYVPANTIRSSITARAQFAQEDQGWRLVALEVPPPE
ncbi:hypothetical protein F183_A25020 [Bryobacterales bacterium F-183]|nr:hypothetical protein F183_A25020 [Bryobacterales bacterium F-183]